MRAVTWCGTERVRVETVDDPRIISDGDIVIRITATTICGSDLHLYDGVIPAMMKGDILGHEPVGEVVEVGPKVTRHKVGDRVAVCSIIACGHCWFCRNKEFSLCDNSNATATRLERFYTHAPAGIFGYSHLFGGYAGAQAEYLRVPFADVNAFTIPEGVTDEQAIAITDAFPTGFQGADLCYMKGGETVVVWGAGPVGLFAMKSAWLLGAERVIAIDKVPQRLAFAAEHCDAETINFTEEDATELLKEWTGGRGPDCCIEACGMECHGPSALRGAYDAIKQTTMLETDRAHTLRQMIMACRKGGTISILGVFAGFVDKLPMGAAFNKALHFHMGQQHGHRYIPRLFEYTQGGQIDPAFCFTHDFRLDEAPDAYETFKHKKDGCIKVVLRT